MYHHHDISDDKSIQLSRCSLQCVMTRAILFHQQKEQSHQYNGGAETGAGWSLRRHAGAGVNTPHLFFCLVCAA